MMKMLLVVLNLLLICSLAFSQRPVVVDNSQYFPPFRGQQNVPNCTNFSLIYYLKSSIWNKELNRNPALEENQFAHSFIWNQNVSIYNSMSGAVQAFHLMKEVGCASVADFPLDETSTALKPDYKAKEKGLAFKSKGLLYHNFKIINENLSYENNLKLFVNQLKDSLIKEKNFVVLIDVYAELIDEVDSGEVYNFHEKYYDQSLRLPTHMVTIAGYNDTIQTANGRGAFMVIDSDLQSSIFYLDYQWFYEGFNTTTIYFLEEDFSSKPELALHLSLEKSLDNRDFYRREYFFVDALYKKGNKLVDYLDFVDVSFRPNIARVVSLNGEKISGDRLPILLPTGSDDGSYTPIADLTEIVSKQDFESIEIIINDPKFGEFHNNEDGVFYSYNRESEVEVLKSFVSIIGTDSIAIGKVTSLSDTTIIFKDFYSLQARNSIGRPLTSDEVEDGIYVKEGKSILARKLITITKDDFMAPLELVNSLDTLVVYQDSVASFQFEAKSQEGNVSYQLALNEDGSINSTTGLFTFSAIYDRNVEEAEWHDFILEVKSGTYTVRDTFLVEVRPRINKFPTFFVVQDSTYHYECVEDSMIEFDYYIYDPEMETIVTGVYDLSEDISGVSQVVDGEHDNQYRFYYQAKEVGEFTVQLFFSDGYHTFTKDINIVVTPYTSTNDRYKPNFALVAYPNPVQDNVYLEFNLPQRGKINIEVYSLTGQLIETAVSDYFESGHNCATFNVGRLIKGTYMCQLRFADGQFVTTRFSKN